MTPQELLVLAEKATPGPYRIEISEGLNGRRVKLLLAQQRPSGTSTVMAELVPGKQNREYLVAAANMAPELARKLIDIGAIVANAFEWDGSGYHIDADAATQLYALLLQPRKTEASK